MYSPARATRRQRYNLHMIKSRGDISHLDIIFYNREKSFPPTPLSDAVSEVKWPCGTTFLLYSKTTICIFIFAKNINIQWKVYVTSYAWLLKILCNCMIKFWLFHNIKSRNCSLHWQYAHMYVKYIVKYNRI